MVNLDCYNAQHCMETQDYKEMDCDNCPLFVHYDSVKGGEDN